jgi:hypothetical protein
MPTRSLIALTAALAIAGTSIAAATAAPGHRGGVRARDAHPVRVQADGVASDWDAGDGSIDLDAADLRGGPRALRRAVRRGATVTLVIGPSTRILVEDADGVRSRETADELFGDLDLASDEVDLEASARVARTARASGGEVVLPATRVVAYLPPAAEGDPGADEDDPGWDDGGDGGAIEDPAPDDGAAG